jgi:nicotinic acid mononucleotide adenylyltransferase
MADQSMDTLQAEYNKLEPRQKAVVLFTTGSMNPVHVGHVRQLELAAKHFQSSGVAVLAALLSPSDCRWSYHKPYGYLKNSDKLELCKLVQTECVKVDDWEISQHSLMDFPDVRAHLINRIQESLGTTDIEVLYVCGADHADKCDLFQNDWCVVLGRPGFRRPRNCHAILMDNKETDESSTDIRKAIKDDRIESVRHMLHPLVYEKLSKTGIEMFQI